MNSCSMKKSLFSRFQQDWKPYAIESHELEDDFHIIINHRGRGQKAKIELQQSILAMNYDQQIDVSNFLITQVQHPLHGEGIHLKSNQLSLEMFGSIDIYLEKLIRYCIQTNFTQKYTVQKLIGAGTYGKVQIFIFQVYRVRSKQDHQNYAVKTFEKELLTNAIDEDALNKEILILRQLHHKGIIKLYEVYESEQFVFLVFDFLKNQNLNQNLEEGVSMTEVKAFAYIKHLLETLTYLHDQEIFHRDIKPDNLVLSNDSQYYMLVDFGLADHYREDGKYLFKDCGTPGYCAPEVLTHQNYDYKVDVFSLGVVLYQLLSGKQPFYSTNYDERVKLNVQARVCYDSLKISCDALDLLQGMLQKNPNKRLSAKQALNHKYFGQQPKSKGHSKLSSLSHISDTLLQTGNQISSPQFENQFDFFELNSNSSRYTSPLHSPLQSPKQFIDELDKEILNHKHTFSYHAKKPSQELGMKGVPKISMLLQRRQII